MMDSHHKFQQAADRETGGMIEKSLQAKLDPAIRQRLRARLAVRLAFWWAVLAILGLFLLSTQHDGRRSSLWLLSLVAISVAGVVLITRRQRRQPIDPHDIARRIESRYPDLDGLLLTAVQQSPDEHGRLNYLQKVVVQRAIQHGHAHQWTEPVTWRIAGAHLANVLALLLLALVLSGLRSGGEGKGILNGGWMAHGVTIIPGDTSIERGERLVVIASFKGPVPAEVTLVTKSPSAPPKRVPLVRSLSDPLFGGSIPEVSTDLVYCVEYAGKRTRDFTVKVFEFPRLERADADLTFPDYTGLAPKRIENTRRVSAVEGTLCSLTLQLNKPVVRARLIPKGEVNQPIPLGLVTNSPVATLAGLAFVTNRTYVLQLVDAEGRTNKSSEQLVVNVLKNREPELKIVSPRGDTRPSALEEITFEGTVWDDFGVKAYGLAYTEGGGGPKYIELGHAVAANQSRTFKHLLRLEDLGVQPDQLITWFLWADDTGPDGQPRRSAGDMYFAEVRPFEEVFRQGQGQGSGEQQGGSGESGGGGPRARLAELQKQIINATWKLRRQQSRQPPAPAQTKPAGSGDAARETSAIESQPSGLVLSMRRVVGHDVFGQRVSRNAPAETPLRRARETLSKIASTNKTATASQFAQDLGVVQDAIDQAIDQAQQQRSAGVSEAALWDSAIRDMERSRELLAKAAKTPQSLAEALAAERSAFQALLKLQQREYEVSRNRNRSQGGQSGREQQMQRQLGQLDLTDPENRYENERLAQAPPSAERREQLQVMNRLGELARRQQDLNDRLQELQTALQEAPTEQQREEIRRELKRLQEEEQRMLADVDDLQQRMNQPQNQSRMSEQRQQLNQTRQEIQRAADAARQGAVSQALASGTRAQRELQQMREDMRKQNSNAFAADLRELRADAREAERRQQEVQKQVDSLSGGSQKTLDDSQERTKSLEQLAQQARRLTNLVDRATQLSQQNEEAEPLASRELYDTLRRFSQEDAKSVREFQDELIQLGLVQTELYRRLGQMAKGDGVKSVELTSELLRQGLLPQARQVGGRANSAVSDLKRGIERAAEKVLGDDTEALRLAQQELNQLSEQVEREIARGQNTATNADGQAQAGDGPARRAPNESQRREQQESAGARQGGSNPQDYQAAAGEPGQQEENAQPSDSAQAGQGERPRDQASASAQNQRGNRGLRDGGRRGGASDSRLPPGLEQYFITGRGGDGNGPVITGDSFVPWSDRLREVEEMVEDSLLRNQLATARERARVLRQDYRQSRQEPNWPTVHSQVVKPLVEVRNQIAEELARRGPRENLVPIDRDPVPSRYSELVRRYYEELGKDE